MTGPITTRDAEVLTFIKHFIVEMGYPPTVREIGLHLGMSSPSTVQAHLTRLTNSGHIERSTLGSPRALRIITQPIDKVPQDQ